MQSLYEIAAVDVTAVLTAYLFYQVQPVAGWLFLPYFAWLSYATALTCSIMRLNPEDETQGATVTEIKDE